MPWIKSDQKLRNHPKILKLVSALRVGKASTIGHLHLLWWWCVDHAQDGVLRDLNDAQIAGAAEWCGDAKVFVTALIGAGFIDRRDGELAIHDWEEWSGDPVRLRRDRQNPTNVVQNTTNVVKSTTNVGSEQYVVTSSVVFSFPSVGKTKTFFLTEQKLKELQEIYPGLDIGLECKKALNWLNDNPARRKTASGMPRFLSGWMDRAQNRRGGYIPSINSPESKKRELDETLKNVRSANAIADDIINRSRENGIIKRT